LFQRVEVLGSDVKVGKGERVRYTVPQIERLFACCELVELGMSPTTAAKLVRDHWADFEPIFNAAQKTVIREPDDNDIVMLLPLVHLMSGNWAPKAGFPGAPVIAHTTLKKLPGKVLGYMNDPAAPRVLLTNLSGRLRRFHNALADVHDLRAGKIESKKGAAGKPGARAKRRVRDQR
jgi:hypothetical protein